MDKIDVIIIGAGIAGITSAYYLHKNFPDLKFKIIESRNDLGGTWDQMKFPGVRADNDMYTYGFSFDPWKGPIIGSGKDIKNYFEYFANIPGLHVKPGSFKSVVQVFGKRRNIAISSGYYEFIKPDGRGGITSIPARFTFAYRKQKYGNKWEIVNHHSSIIPKQPPILQGVSNQLRFQKFNMLDSYQLHLRQRAHYCEKVKEYKKMGKLY